MARPKAKMGGTVVFVDADEVVGLISRVAQSVEPSSLTGFMEEEAWPFFRKRIMDRFGSEGDKASGNWPPLSPVTISIKVQNGSAYPDHPNVRTGEMFAFLTESHAVGTTSGGAELTFPGDSNPLTETKIKVAQLGDWRVNTAIPGARPAPPRPVLAIDETDTLEMLKMLSVHVIKAAQGTGGIPSASIGGF